MLAPNLNLIEQIEKQLNLLGYGIDEKIFFRAIKTGQNGGCQKIKGQAEKIPYQRLQELQSHGYNLYIVVNGQGNTDSEVKFGRAIFYEHDNLSKDIQQDLWQHLNLPEPTFQVDTGGKSIHSYWVFEEPIAIEQWKQLQTDLLEYADADRSIKNPSRVMRLAGSLHQSSLLLAAIISSSGKRYTYDWLRAIVPIPSVALPSVLMPSVAEKSATSLGQKQWIPQIPLENCLTKEHRDFIAGGISEGGRNKAGAALARDLLGTAARLEYLGISYSGNPLQLFEEFCSRCSPPLMARETETIWKSALKSNPTACLTDNALANCVKAWEYANTKTPTLCSSATHNGSASVAGSYPLTENTGGSDLGSGGSGGNGSGSLPPNDRPDPDEVFRLEVLAYSDELNLFKKLRLKGQICANYRISAKELQSLVDSLKGRLSAPKSKRYTGAEFLLLETEGIKWLIPGVIPGRGVTILGGAPGAGKTTIAYDMAASILYQESFLGENIDNPGKVLFVSSDEGGCFAQDKLINRGFTFDDRWQFVTDWDISQKQEFEEYLDDFRPQFVMMDSFAAIHRDPNFDENSSQAKAAVYWLESMANKYGCAILLIHHCNKNREQKGVAKLRGSTAIAGACSAVLLLEGEGNVKSFSAQKIRGSEHFKWDIKLDPETGRWSVVQGKTDDSAAKSLSEKILTIFESKYPTARLEVSEIREEVGGQPDALYKALDRLCKRGLLVKRPSEKNRRFKVYGLPIISTEITLDTVLEHSPPTMPIIHSDPTSENITGVELQTLDTTLDTDRTTLDASTEEKAEPLIENESQTLDMRSLDEGESVSIQQEQAVNIQDEINELAEWIEIACSMENENDTKEALVAIQGIIASVKSQIDNSQVNQFRIELWNKLSDEQKSKFKSIG